MAKRFVISISGHGESGKDEFALMLAEFTGLKYIQSTSEIIKEVWWDEILGGVWSAKNARDPECVRALRMGLADIIIEPETYPSIEAVYADRRNRREEWKTYIGTYNVVRDPLHGIATYKHTVYRGNDFLCGIRQRREFLACKEHLIAKSIWLNRPGTPVDPTQEYGPDLCDVVVANNGTLDELREKAWLLSDTLLIPAIKQWSLQNL